MPRNRTALQSCVRATHSVPSSQGKLVELIGNFAPLRSLCLTACRIESISGDIGKLSRLVITPHPSPHTLNPEPCTLNTKLRGLNPTPQTPDPEP